jgi:hypothetical protein
MKVLVACECSGVVRNAFRELGHDAWSCDLQPDESTYEGRHVIASAQHLLQIQPEWDLIIAHPPCTYLASSGLHWNRRQPERQAMTEEALRFVQWLMDLPTPRIAIENPVGCISTRIRPADQYIQPWMFGEDASKKTGLWLKGLPPLQPTGIITKERYANQTPSGQNRLGPSPHRAKLRSRTYPGIARAMAMQWGKED